MQNPKPMMRLYRFGHWILRFVCDLVLDIWNFNLIEALVKSIII